MNYKFSSIFIGCIVAFLPLYIRFSSVNLDRVSKSNALLCLIPALVILFGNKVKEFSLLLKLVFIGLIAHLILFQFEPASYVGIYQSIAISLSLLFIVKYSESNDGSDRNLILNFICLGAMIQIIIVLSQYLNFDLYERTIMIFNPELNHVVTNEGGPNLFSGTLFNPNLYGAYLALCLPAFFRPTHFLYAVPVVIAILMTKSLMPIATMVSSIAFYFLARNKEKEYWLYVLAPVSFLACCFILPEATSGRMQYWSTLIDKIDIIHALFGKSASWFSSLDLKVGSDLIGNEHNEFLTIFNIFGILGLAALTYLISLIIKNQSKDKCFATIVFAAFVNMLGNFPLHTAATSFIILIAVSHCLKGSYGIDLDR